MAKAKKKKALPYYQCNRLSHFTFSLFYLGVLLTLLPHWVIALALFPEQCVSPGLSVLLQCTSSGELRRGPASTPGYRLCINSIKGIVMCTFWNSLLKVFPGDNAAAVCVCVCHNPALFPTVSRGNNSQARWLESTEPLQWCINEHFMYFSRASHSTFYPFVVTFIVVERPWNEHALAFALTLLNKIIISLQKTQTYRRWCFLTHIIQSRRKLLERRG